MSLFNFNHEEMLTFFAVLVRYSVLISVLPFLGDRFVPAPLKVLLSLALTIALFPALVSSGMVRPGDAVAWGSTTSGIVGTIALEAIFALVLGYVARIAFEAVNFGGNLAGTFMGFAIASTYDPNQQSQTQVVAEIHMALAMLLFLVLDGHHLMIRAALGSYGTVGIGGAGTLLAGASGSGGAFSARLVELTAQVLRFGLQLAAPVAIALFGVNVVFGVMARAMPQLNALVLSIGVSALIGLMVMFLSLGELQAATGELLGRIGEWMNAISVAIAKGR